MFKRLTLVLLTVLFVQNTFAQDTKAVRSPEAGTAYNEGNTLVKQKNFSKAIVKYQKAIKADDNFPEAHYMLAISFQKTGKYKKALVEFKNAITKNNKFEKAYISLAKLQTGMDKTADAINTNNAVLAFNPKSAKANYGLGKIYFSRKDYVRAEKYLIAAIAANVKYGRAYNILGLVYNGEKKYAKASVNFGNAIKYTRNRLLKANYSYRLGVAQIKAGHLDKAETALLAAVKMTNKNSIRSGCNFYLGEIYKKQKSTQKAIRYYRLAQKSKDWQKSAAYEINLLKHPDKYVR